MKYIRTLGLLLLSLIIFWTGVAASSDGANDIIVNGANTFHKAQLAGSEPLNQNAAGVATRIIQSAANSELQLRLTALDAPLQSLTELVPERVLVAASNSTRIQPLGGLAQPLSDLLSQVVARTIVQAANSTRTQSVIYPFDLVKDRRPPAINTPLVEALTPGALKLHWQSDGFTTALFRYGTQSGVYTEEIALTLYARNHTVELTNLTAGSTYFYQITSTDISGNTTTSPEGILTLQQNHFLYLPFVRR
ncbi:MAG: hypothetical protein DCC55_32870 [Chloroflexi bacterium]|nr:MAG: hypothetical protein DCC55_32870 [Chloroflexota bacterium]